jgi:hypothetical protein
MNTTLWAYPFLPRSSCLIDSSFGEIGEHPSALLEWLHLVALRDCVSLWISLVTLGVYQHLDGLEQRGLLTEGGVCLWLWSVDCEGLLCLPHWRSWKATLVDWAWLVWSSSCLGCAAPKWVSMCCLLALEPPLSESPQRGLACRQASEPQRKNHCVILSPWFSLVFIDWSLGWLGIITLPLSLVFTFIVILCRACGSLASWVA